jgi:hypothetical protein
VITLMWKAALWIASTSVLAGCFDMQPVLAQESAPALGLALVVVTCWFSGRERRGGRDRAR